MWKFTKVKKKSIILKLNIVSDWEKEFEFNQLSEMKIFF